MFARSCPTLHRSHRRTSKYVVWTCSCCSWSPRRCGNGVKTRLARTLNRLVCRFYCSRIPVGPKKKSKAQKEAERLQAEEDERKAEILRAKREAERIRKEAEDAKRLKEEQVCMG